MRSDRQRFLHMLATLGAFLGGEVRINSDDLTASTCSLVGQDGQKRTPASIQDALRQPTPGQRPDVQIFHNNGLVRIRIPFRNFEMKVSPLALDLQMGLRHALRHFAAAVTPFLPRTQSALLAVQGCLARPEATRVDNGFTFAIGKEDFQPNVDTNRRAVISRMGQVTDRRNVTDNQPIPMPISPLDLREPAASRRA